MPSSCSEYRNGLKNIHVFQCQPSKNGLFIGDTNTELYYNQMVEQIYYRSFRF
jgi:hypothetical protein